MLTHILSNMPGLTDEQKKKTIQAAKELIKNPTQKKSEFLMLNHAYTNFAIHEHRLGL